MKRLLRQEDGIALVLALGVSVVLTIFVVSMISYTTANLRSAGSDRSRITALSLAESGISAAASILNQAANASAPTLLGCATSAQNANNSALPCTDLTVSSASGSAYIHGIYTQGAGSTGTWTITSYGSVPNPSAGAAPLKETMTATVAITGGGVQNNISIWNYLYSTAPQGSGCEVDLNQDHTTINVPVYVTGDLCISGDHAAISEDKASGGQAVDLRVGGTLSITGNHATVGSAQNPLTSGYIGGGCITSALPAAHSCTTGDHYYVSQLDSPLTAVPPTTDFPGWYVNASPGPGHICDPVLTPSPNLTAATNAFDNDAVLNGTNTAFVLTPLGSDYNCVTSTGTLKWNHSSHLLTISGTIYFDGNVSLNDGAAFYHGKATIYVNGQLSFNNGHGSAAGLRAGCPASPAPATKQCKFNTKTDWDPGQDMVVFVVNKSSGTAVDLSTDHSEFQGDLLCTPTSTASLAGDHTAVEGGIICGKFAWGDHTQIYPLPTIMNLPPGAPVPPNAPATIGQPVITGA
jgi:hypothetical protein